MKELFDRMAREGNFKKGDLALRWDTSKEDKGKNAKLTSSGLVRLALQESMKTIHSSYKIWKESIPHYQPMGNT